jgi:hypothetical protein
MSRYEQSNDSVRITLNAACGSWPNEPPVGAEQLFQKTARVRVVIDKRSVSRFRRFCGRGRRKLDGENSPG